jgi:putative SOS response-associated peptidase YedK
VWLSRPDGDLFAFAGVWAALPARDGSGELHSCAIVTCEPNGLIRPIHDRMPVVLDPEVEGEWIEPDTSEDELMRLLRPAPEGWLVARDVGDSVNDVRGDGPHLIEPRASQPQLF